MTGSETMEKSTYEVLRARLTALAGELGTGLAALDARRRALFDAVETRLTGASTVATAVDAAPRDAIALGDRILVGWTLPAGARDALVLGEVLTALEVRGDQVQTCDLPLTGFEQDFAELARYYRSASFSHFTRTATHLYAVFRVGQAALDVKAFAFKVESGRSSYAGLLPAHQVPAVPQVEIAWRRAGREQHRNGAHPHVSLDDRVFVETVGGDLTVKLVDDTDTPRGIYAEPVEDRDQGLDDAEIHYAVAGALVLLKVRPYREKTYRHLVYSEKTRQVTRVDALEQACLLLPENQGLIHPAGCVLQSGEVRVFDVPAGTIFDERIASPGGARVLHAFRDPATGARALMAYDAIDQQVAAPLIVQGCALLADGRLLAFRPQSGAARSHALSIYTTPYAAQDQTSDEARHSLLGRVGHREVVRALAAAREVVRLCERDESYPALYEELARKSRGALDAFHWLSEPELALAGPLERAHEAACAAVDEFARVTRLRDEAAAQLAAATTAVEAAVAAASSCGDLESTIAGLATLRTRRGEVLALNDLRHVDRAQVAALEARLGETESAQSRRCGQLLLEPTALAKVDRACADLAAALPAVARGSDARKLVAEGLRQSDALALLLAVINDLPVEDALERTAILDRVTAACARLNAVRAQIASRATDLARAESATEFTSRLRLIDQAVSSQLEMAATPEACTEGLSRAILDLEQLEARIAEVPELVARVESRRTEINAAFETRRSALLDARARRAAGVAAAAERVLSALDARLARLATPAEIHGLLASDPMVEKLRALARQLEELSDPVRAADVTARLAALRDVALRQQRDRTELAGDLPGTVRLGRHAFTVGRSAPELTTLMRDGRLHAHLTGTRYFEPLTSPELDALSDLARRELASESAEVYRAEYLAYHAFTNGTTIAQEMSTRLSDGYVRGVHDRDADEILSALKTLRSSAGTAVHTPDARALARAWWASAGEADRTAVRREARAARALARAFGAPVPAKKNSLFVTLRSHEKSSFACLERISVWAAQGAAFDPALAPEAAAYLLDELATGDSFVESREALALVADLRAQLAASDPAGALLAAIAELAATPDAALELARAALDRVVGSQVAALHRDEAAVLLVTGGTKGRPAGASLVARIDGLTGEHARLAGGSLELHLNEFITRLSRFVSEEGPRFARLVELRAAALAALRGELDLASLEAKPLAGFVRNALVDQVYLPLVGDNLARQIGVAGDQRSADRMGLLLLVSPPGYGKTTLMEYVARTLGLTFVKVDGPALGHRTVSLDPAGAPDAAARRELIRLNLALEMGDNVMLYLDDVQHLSSELLQKFIPLCDGQRKIEGVWRGASRTHDLRGRRVAVVMAGNPYTENGGKFEIPDMLANRADVHNLGDVAGRHAEAFAASYLENACGAHPVLAAAARRSQADMRLLIDEACGKPAASLSLAMAPAERAELVATLRHLTRIRDVVLAVNRRYIASAAQADAYRTEPPFLLQGSYRDMAKMAGRVRALMTTAEVDALWAEHYQAQAQTLRGDAEANLLALREMMGALDELGARRLAEIRAAFARQALLRGAAGAADDPAIQVVAQLADIRAALSALRPEGGLSPQMVRALETERRMLEAWGVFLDRCQAPSRATRELKDALAEALGAYDSLVKAA